MKQKHMHIRIPMYFIGLFIMTTGVALSVKSNLGVSPVSSIPYTITCVWGVEMGKATILFHIVLVILQILLLRKNFKAKSLLQVVVGVIFGYFTTFCNYIASFLLTPDNYPVRIAMLLVSTILVAFGIFLYLPADLIPLAGEGAMSAVSQISGMEFAKVKVRFDCSMVVISMTTCLIALHSLGSVGVGTIAAAILVGTVLGFINKLVGDKRDRLLGKIPDKNTDENVLEDDEKQNYVITISREFGSGGHEIGTKLAQRLGVKCYDKELLAIAAKESGLCEDLFESQDEKPTNSFLYSLVMDTYSLGYTNSYVNMPINHKLFLAQFDAIKKLAEKESCVIVGRCADYALEDDPFAVSVFIKADLDKRIERIKKTFELPENKAADLIQKTDKKRASYYNYYSSKKWGEAKSYDLCIDSGELGIEGAIDLIIKYVELKERNNK